mgnify:CR=1 FL=1
MSEFKYTDEQIMIRAMPCPNCYAKPRQLCDRRPNKNGMIINHQDRQLLFHDFIKSIAATGFVEVHDGEWSVTAEAEQSEYERQQESMRTGK